MGIRTAQRPAARNGDRPRSLCREYRAERPVYLSLPREVLAAPLPGFSFDSPARRVAAAPPGPDNGAIDKPPLIDLDELPAFDQVCAVAGGYGERVEDPAALPAALDRAVRAVTVKKRQALLKVVCRGV
jgi:hypothetical protein